MLDYSTILKQEVAWSLFQSMIRYGWDNFISLRTISISFVDKTSLISHFLTS